MFSNSEMLNPLLPFFYRLIGYSLSMVCGNLVYRCSYELIIEYKNITLGSMRMYGIIKSLLLSKYDSNRFQMIFIVAALASITVSTEIREIIFKQSDFWIIFILTVFLLTASSLTKSNQLEDTYKYFIRNSGLDCGSFMAYSFYHGYIKYVVASSGDVSSKGLVERMTDYEATEQVCFPIKKLLILQPKSMFLPPTLTTELLQNANNLEEVKINVGGVVNRSYQLSVYKIDGPDWYVNVQGASPLITYYEESKRSKMLDKYKTDVAHSFRNHLENMINDDIRCRGLVEVIYYDDFDKDGERIDVGLVLQNYIEEHLERKASSGT